MPVVTQCKICGHPGDKQNPLCHQGLYKLPYCCDCMLKASMKATRDPMIRAAAGLEAPAKENKKSK